MITEAEFQALTQSAVQDCFPRWNLASSADGFSVQIEDEAVRIEVTYDGPRSHELSIWVGQTGQRDPPFELADVLRMTDCSAYDVASVESIQTDDLEVLQRLMRRAFALLRDHAAAFLAGDAEAFRAAAQDRSARAKSYTNRVRISGVVVSADAAWSRRDMNSVVELLDPVRDLLEQRDLRRLSLAKKRIANE